MRANMDCRTVGSSTIMGASGAATGCGAAIIVGATGGVTGAVYCARTTVGAAVAWAGAAVKSSF